MEYSHHHGGNNESSNDNNYFLKLYKQYKPNHWLDLATGKKDVIPKIKLENIKQFNFNIKSDHYKMHYLEMLKLTQIYFDDLSIVEKFKLFHQWVYDNILICKYTTFFAALVFGNKSKLFKKTCLEYETVIKNCSNQAWNLTYLSYWSTYYYYEDSVDDIYLFATMDKELKELFFLTHKESNEIYTELFGDELGREIIQAISQIYKIRQKQVAKKINLDKMIIEEQEKLKSVL